MSSEDEMDDFEVSDYDMLGALGKLKELWGWLLKREKNVF